MDFRFSNLLGTVYRRGNVCFTEDGFQLISPVGNRVTVFDLRHDRSHTLQLEASYDIEHIALSPDNALLLAVDCKGEAHLVAMATGAAIARQKLPSRVSALAYSPDGDYFAMARDNRVHVYHGPGLERYFNQFKLYRSYYGNRDEVTSIAWSSDSKAFVCACRDLQVRVFSLHKTARLPGCYSLGGFTEDIVGVAFLPDSLNLFAVSSAGFVMLWQCDTELSDLLIKQQQQPQLTDGTGDDNDDSPSDSEDCDLKETKNEENKPELEKIFINKLRYLKPKKMRLREDAEDSKRVSAVIDCLAFCPGSKQLVCGTEDGRVMLYAVDNCALLLSLQVCDSQVDSVSISPDGLWIAAAGAAHGQLLVWDWRASAYVMRQAGSFNCLRCAAFSPDGGQLVCGYSDGRVRLWSSQSSLSFATLTEHTSCITGVRFCGKRVVIASSADGSIRAWDLGRYRNFRTLVSPTPLQLSCLDADPSGDLIAAGCLDEFHLLIWSLKTGRLLVTLTGHTAPVSCVAFRPGPGSTILASGSWDSTVRLWDVLGSDQQPEVIQCGHDVLSLAWRPDGQQLSVAINNGTILVMDAVPSGSGTDAPEFQSTRTIDCRQDLGYDKPDGALISGRRLAEAGGGFNSLSYSPTGQLLLAGGLSKHICLYSPSDQLLLRKFPVTANRSLKAVALEKRAAKLVRDLGVRAGSNAGGTEVNFEDDAVDSSDARVSVTGVSFSPAGDMFLAACTEGVLLYCSPGSRHLLPSESLVASCRRLTLRDTPQTVVESIQAGRFGDALDVALRINQPGLVRQCLEATPTSGENRNLVDLLCSQLPLDTCRDVLAPHVADWLADSNRLEHCMAWARAVARVCCLGQSNTARQRRDPCPGLTRLQRAVGDRRSQLERICSGNMHTLDYLCHLAGGLGDTKSSKAGDALQGTDDGELPAQSADLEPMETME
uniref:Utp12 domain-containing protein n=2 Tax=Macrostomum lignano TaxID=282301 RepID=A0A1I8FW62_9PLAT